MLVLFVGCQSTSEIIPLSSNTYIISRSDLGPLGTLTRVRGKVLQDVNEFALKNGKVAIPITSKSVSRNRGVPYFEYQFMLVEKNDPRASGGALMPRADFVIESTSNINANINKSRSENNYDAIAKLNKLRESGAISEQEFESEKGKLLSR